MKSSMKKMSREEGEKRAEEKAVTVLLKLGVKDESIIYTMKNNHLDSMAHSVSDSTLEKVAECLLRLEKKDPDISPWIAEKIYLTSRVLDHYRFLYDGFGPYTPDEKMIVDLTKCILRFEQTPKIAREAAEQFMWMSEFQEKRLLPTLKKALEAKTPEKAFEIITDVERKVKAARQRNK
jgi:hypothetical protein